MAAAEKPIPEDALPELRALATAMRDAKAAAKISYKELGRRTNYSTASLSQAASGKKLPTWDVTWAYARGCDCGDTQDDWDRLWKEARDAVRQNAVPRSTTAAASGQGADPRPSVADLIREEFERQQQSQAGQSETNRMRTALALCVSTEEFRFLLRKLMNDLRLEPDDVKERARQKGYILRKLDIRAMTSRDSQELPDLNHLNAYLAACEVDAAVFQDWHHTAARLKILQAMLREPTPDDADLLTRLKIWLLRSIAEVRLEALIGLFCTLLVTIVQVAVLVVY